MSDRRIRENVEVHSFLDLDLNVVLTARNGLADPEKWIQGHLGKGQRKCWAGHLLKAGEALRQATEECQENADAHPGAPHWPCDALANQFVACKTGN